MLLPENESFLWRSRHQFFDRDFIGKTAVAIASFAALQKIAGADRSKSDPEPANPMLDGQNPEWLAHTPPELVMAHLHIDKATFDAIPKNDVSVTPLSERVPGQVRVISDSSWVQC